mmetsp:Transcript_11107/g.36835  ORF Transcript_11107/g.36835 Transcript_11107/m.36835 type:complete len:230 (-) Transcript_11107:51-740(-)|eukprot:scaffold10051_cov90-Isochrysis_galbana.AAC.5
MMGVRAEKSSAHDCQSAALGALGASEVALEKTSDTPAPQPSMTSWRSGVPRAEYSSRATAYQKTYEGGKMARPRVSADSSHSNRGAIDVHSIDAAKAVSSLSSRTSASDSSSQHVRPMVCIHSRKQSAVRARKPLAAASASAASVSPGAPRPPCQRPPADAVPTGPSATLDSSQNSESSCHTGTMHRMRWTAAPAFRSRRSQPRARSSRTSSARSARRCVSDAVRGIPV